VHSTTSRLLAFGLYFIFNIIFNGNVINNKKNEVPLFSNLSITRWGYESLVVYQYLTNDYTKKFYRYDITLSHCDFIKNYYLRTIKNNLNSYYRKIYKRIDPRNNNSEEISDVRAQMSQIQNKKQLNTIEYDKLKELTIKLNHLLSNDLDSLLLKENFKSLEIVKIGFQNIDSSVFKQLDSIENIDDFFNKLKSEKINYETYQKNILLLDKLNQLYVRDYNIAYRNKDSVLESMFINKGIEEVNKLKKENINESISEIVRNSNNLMRICVVDNEIIQIMDPIYFYNKAPLDYHKYFFTPEKYITKKVSIPTYWFNSLVLIVFAIFLFVISRMLHLKNK